MVAVLARRGSGCGIGGHLYRLPAIHGSGNFLVVAPPRLQKRSLGGTAW